MEAAELLSEAERHAAVTTLCAWAEDLMETQVAVGYEFIAAGGPDARDRWLLRFEGIDREYITIWFTLDQRTLQYETQFTPCLEGNETPVLSYLMKRNAHLRAMAFAIGPEEAIYLMGRISARSLSSDTLDDLAGLMLAYVEDHFATAMALAFPGKYRRRKA